MSLTCSAGATAVAMAKGSKEAEFNPQMRVIHLNLADLEELIRGYETKYQVSTVTMLSNADARARINEDDLLEWEAYVNQRSGLREYYEMVHREYLHNRSAAAVPPGNKTAHTAQEEKIEYAA